MKKIYASFALIGISLLASQNAMASSCLQTSAGLVCSSSEDDKFEAASLYSTSGASRATGTVFKNIVDKVTTTRNQQKQLANVATGLHLSVADLRYEHADFRTSSNSGEIGGFTASGSYDFNENFSAGLLVPYDYLSFDMFNGNRTGVIGYGKGKLKLLPGLEASATVNGNYIYTTTDYKTIANSVDLHTYGGGFSTLLDYDKGGDFLTALAFSIQYNQDNTNQLDDHQYLVKLGPSVGYRIGDNAVVKVYGTWNKDVTDYRTTFNKLKDGEFFDVGVESAYSISDTWQLKGGYKKMLDLQAFDSDAVYLGSSLQF